MIIRETKLDMASFIYNDSLHIKDAMSNFVSLIIRSQIMQHVKFTKWNSIAKGWQHFITNEVFERKKKV